VGVTDEDDKRAELPDVPAEEPEATAAGESTVEEEPAAAAGDDRPRRFFPSGAGALIALLLAVLGFAFVVQLRSTDGDSELASARLEDLVRIQSDLNARAQRLTEEIAGLQGVRNQLASGAEGREAALEQARRRADELGILAGTLPAEGDGLRIELRPGSADRPIRAATVLDAVEELRGAGAEAMQITGVGGTAVRIVASTYFTDAADGRLVVDDVVLVAPYTLTVIGPGQTMRTALTIPGGVADAVGRDDGTVIVSEPGTVTILALHQEEDLRYARPVS
jgi:uncharacterized protein YlxW (UPF0749 family)